MSITINGSGPQLTLRRRIFSLPTLVSFAIAIVFIYFLAIRFDLDWDKTWQNVKSMDPLLYVVALGLYYLSFVSRGVRWRILVQNAGFDDVRDGKLPSIPVFAQLIVMGWFVNSVTYLRMGDAYRAYALSDRSGAGFSWGLGTILAERVVDMVTVLVLIVVGVTWYSATRDTGGVLFIAAVAFVMAAVLTVMLLLMRGYGARLARFLPNRFEPAYHRFQKGTLGSLGQLRLVFLLGLVSWLLEVGRLYFVVQALGMDVPVALVLIVALGHAILSTVPTPGGIGAVEPGVTGLLVLWLERSDAVSVALVDRSITYLSIIVFGGLAFLAWQLTRRRRPTADTEAETPVTDQTSEDSAPRETSH